MKTVDKSIDVEPRPQNINTLNIAIRGDIFRGTINDQIDCIKSIRQQVTNFYDESDIKLMITLCTYKHPLDFIFTKIVKTMFDGVKVYDFRIAADNKLNQEDNFSYCLKKCSKLNSNVLIVRPDILFTDNIGVCNFNEEQFLFQWNYFHNYNLKEMPDQYHYIGKKILNDVTSIVEQNIGKLGKLKSNEGAGSLHNLYNILSESHIDRRNVSYMKQYSLDDNMFDGYRCLMRGNSEVSLGSNPYIYKRTANRKILLVKTKLVRWYGWCLTKLGKNYEQKN